MHPYTLPLSPCGDPVACNLPDSGSTRCQVMGVPHPAQPAEGASLGSPWRWQEGQASRGQREGANQSLGSDSFIFQRREEQTREIIVVEPQISNVWSPFYSHSLGAHYGNFSSITGKLYNESDDKPASMAKICVFVQLLAAFPPLSSQRSGHLVPLGAWHLPSQLHAQLENREGPRNTVA